MKIREATIDDAESIKNVHLQAFENSEARIVSDLAINLLNENHPAKTISLVAIENNEIAGHAAFSPVFLESTIEHFGYIVAPLAVSPKFQKKIYWFFVGQVWLGDYFQYRFIYCIRLW